jgi:hypothetical protein
MHMIQKHFFQKHAARLISLVRVRNVLLLRCDAESRNPVNCNTTPLLSITLIVIVSIFFKHAALYGPLH